MKYTSFAYATGEKNNGQFKNLYPGMRIKETQYCAGLRGTKTSTKVLFCAGPATATVFGVLKACPTKSIMSDTLTHRADTSITVLLLNTP